MDILELPRPVINFLRTMSKEMSRYSLCWDIYGGTESVTLTLTWKLNDFFQTSNNTETNAEPNPIVNPIVQANQTTEQVQEGISNMQKNYEQTKQSDTDTNSLLRKSRKFVKDDKQKTSRGKSVENIQNSKPKTENSSIYDNVNLLSTMNRSNTINNDLSINNPYKKIDSLFQHLELLKQCPPSSAHKQRIKSSTFIQQDSDDTGDPWIKRNTDIISNNNNNNNTTTMQNGYSNYKNSILNSHSTKVKFDPNLHFI